MSRERGQATDLVCALAKPHEEVVRLDVPVDKALAVHVLYPGNLQCSSSSGGGLYWLHSDSIVGHSCGTSNGDGGAVYQLVCQHEDRLHRELPVAEIEEVLQTRPQQVDDHCVVLALDSVPPDVGDAGCKQQCQLNTPPTRAVEANGGAKQARGPRIVRARRVHSPPNRS